MMAGIRGRDTRPELSIRKALHRAGLRYRLHSAQVTGRPDVVFPSRKAAVFIHGCFWHGHDCKFFRLPGTRREFWEAKINRNRDRDALVSAQLADAGWRQLVVWECAVRGRDDNEVEEVAARVADWLRSDQPRGEIRGP
jgi:DNA mismatch endonuclease (patch repair protein)